MSAEGWRGYDALIAELRRLGAERRTGTLFIATGDNQGGQVALRDGAIAAVRLGRKTGLDAARDLRAIRAVQFDFTRDLMTCADPRQPLSSTAAWSALTGATEDGGPLDDGPETVRTILTTALAEYLGPMAAIVVRDQLREAERAGREPADVIETLARGIEDPAGAAAFREQATAALRSRRRP